MILQKQDITESVILEWFPQLVRDGYKYGIELSALKANGRKTYITGHLSVFRYREDNGFIFREILPQSVACVRVAFDKPLRSTDRSKMLIESAVKMRESCARCALDDAHPYVRFLATI